MKTRHVFFVVLMLGVGLSARTLSDTDVARKLARLLPWAEQITVSLYFADSSGQYVVPVSRRMSPGSDLARIVLADLLAGPGQNTGLVNSIPPRTELRSLSLTDGVARVDFSADFLTGKPELTKIAVVETLTTVPGVTSVALSVEGKPLGTAMKRMPLLYFASAKGLWALPTSATGPRAALAAYLSGPPAPNLIGLPSDVQVRAYQYEPSNGLLSLNLSYTSAVRTLALNDPDAMRRVLTGLIASLTEYPEVQAVQLDFEGHARLGLGQCSDLLRVPQPRPGLLNDERLLSR